MTRFEIIREIIIANQWENGIGTILVLTVFGGGLYLLTRLADRWSRDEAQEAEYAARRDGFLEMLRRVRHAIAPGARPPV